MQVTELEILLCFVATCYIDFDISLNDVVLVLVLVLVLLLILFCFVCFLIL